MALRQIVAKNYDKALNEIGIMTTPYIEPHNISAYAQYTIRVSERDELQIRLKEKGIPTAVHYPLPLNKQPAVASNVILPVGDQIAQEVISLPMHPYLSKKQLIIITNAIQ
ncbi:aminotransferase (fragment) [Xenorhabdus nematophila str. Websteri]